MSRFIYCFAIISLFCSSLYAADFWQPAGLYGGSTQPIAFAANGDIYIGTGSGGLFYSSDEGESWKGVNHKTFFFQRFAFDSEGRLWGIRWAIPGLVYSDDNGKTWTGGLDTAFDYDASMIVLPDNTILISRPIAGVLRSDDRGATWTRYNNFAWGDTYTTALAFDSTDASVYVGVMGTGLFHSQDEGKSWTKYLQDGLEYDKISVLPEHLLTVSNESVYLIEKENKTVKEIYKGTAYDRFNALATLSDNTIIAGKINGDVLISHDLGNTWKQHSLTTFIQDIKVSPNGTIILTSRDGVWRSTDRGDSWQPANTGILGQDVQMLFTAKNNVLFAATTMGKLFRSVDHGVSWIDVSLGIFDYPVSCMTQTADGTLYAGTGSITASYQGKGVYISHDEGLSWEQINSGLQDTIIRGIGSSATDVVYVATDKAGVFRQRMDKTGWEQTALTGTAIWSLLIDSNATIFAGAAAGKIYRSRDAGTTWSSVQLPTSSDVQSLAQAPDGTLYAVVFEGRGYYSEDDGDTWLDVGVRDSMLLAVAVDHQGQVYTAGENSFVRKQKSAAWENVTGNIASHVSSNAFYCLALTDDNTPLMGTSRGVFKGSAAPSSIPFTESNKIQLSAYPNPVRSLVTIELSIPRQTNIELAIFNEFGERIATVVERVMEPGVYAIPWTPEAIPSGLYYCRLTCGSHTQTKILTVIR